MRNTLTTALIAGVVLALPAAAQEPSATGGTVVSSEPGRVVAASTIQASATVTAIDKPTRTVTLKGPEGRLVDVVAGDEVRNFDQIKVGDRVVARYVEALTLELRKSGGGAQSGGMRERTETGAAERAQPGERPAGAAGREVTIVADVLDVNPKKSTITLRGPKGRVVDLKVRNPDHFKVVKKGDQVEAVYTQAIALAVEPAAKK